MNQRLSVFIDAANLRQVRLKKSGFIDMEKLTSYLKDRFLTSELTVYYYTAFPKEGTRKITTKTTHSYFFLFRKKARVYCQKETSQTSL
jgi:hypothetical protein